MMHLIVALSLHLSKKPDHTLIFLPVKFSFDTIKLDAIFTKKAAE